MGDSVQQIKDRLSILDVISPYVELHRAGKNFKGKSPFTAEKTPSFYVSPDRGMYYSFSTSQVGDMFTFVQAMEGVDFKGALKLLADKAGVELVAEDPKKKTERERWYAATQDAATYYVEQLEKNKEALAYLENRGVTKATLQKWQIGFAPGPPAHGWRMKSAVHQPLEIRRKPRLDRSLDVARFRPVDTDNHDRPAWEPVTAAVADDRVGFRWPRQPAPLSRIIRPHYS